ncbi:hypothetical protein, partial [Endozoicomonas sp. ONNA2]|uniref:hypothetical protein n=1 Tax=Endozoicomonas sp. ONNA2 TaxID=2828741 RepID=UPI0021492F37
MIRQPDINPTGIVIDPQPVTTPEPNGRWQGLGVIKLGKWGSEFVRSLNPFYQPPNDQPPVRDAPHIDYPGQSGHCLPLTTLAVRTIAACANLPPEINQALGYLADLVAAGRAASDQFDATVSSAREPGLDTHRKNPPDATLEITKDKRRASQNPRQPPDKTATATLYANHLP